MKEKEKISIEKGPHFLAIDSHTNNIYVANSKSNCILVIDDSSKIIKRIEIIRPGKLVINSSNKKLFAITDLNWKMHGTMVDKMKEMRDGDLISIIDTESNEIVGVIDEGDYSDFDINLSTNHFVSTNTDVSTLSIVDLSTNKEIKQIEIGLKASSVAINYLTNKIYVGYEDSPLVRVIDGNTLDILEEFEIPEQGEFYINSKFNMLYVLHREFFEYNEFTTYEYDRLYGIDLQSKKMIKQIPEKKRSLLDKTFREKNRGHNSLTLDPNQDKVYFTDAKKNKVIVLDHNLQILEENKVSKFSNPAIAFNPSTNLLFITSEGIMKNHLHVVEI